MHTRTELDPADDRLRMAFRQTLALGGHREQQKGSMKRTIGLLVSGLVALSIVSTAGLASAQGANATLHVLHAVPGATVDVCVDGAGVKSNFEYKRRFTAELPAGEYRVVVRAAAASRAPVTASRAPT